MCIIAPFVAPTDLLYWTWFSDGGVLNNSTFGELLMRGTLPFPLPQQLPGTSGPDLPYGIVGDEAFPLRENMLRPYPGRNLPGNQLLF